jgi:hypothetical protein
MFLDLTVGDHQALLVYKITRGTHNLRFQNWDLNFTIFYHVALSVGSFIKTVVKIVNIQILLSRSAVG